MASQYEDIFRPLTFTGLPPSSQVGSYQDDIEDPRAEYQAIYHASQPLFPPQAASDQERQNSPEILFSIPRKPVGGLRTSDTSSSKKGHYEHIGISEPRQQVTHLRGLDFLSTWWLELLCCVLFVGALIAVVLTVRPYEGKPLPQWRYHLSINSLVSVYIVVLKAAILLVTAEGLSQLKWRWFRRDRPLKDLEIYDSASRGPWGSLTLIWNLRGRQLVSSIGAFVTVAVLIVDPFAQQIISTYDCKLPTSSVRPTIPRTRYFAEEGLHTGAGRSTVSLPLQASVNAGIFSPGISVGFDCPTGNCTFSDGYHTVGYCSRCVDATAELSLRTEPDLQNLTSWFFTLPANITNPSSTNITAFVTTHNAGEGSDSFILGPGYKFGVTDIILTGGTIDRPREECGKSCPLLTDAAYDDCTNNWQDFRWGCTGFNGSWSTNFFGAAHCSLDPCVKTYKAVVDKGRLIETLVSIATEWGFAGQNSNMVDLECLNEQDRRSLTNAGYELGDQPFIPYNITWDPTSGNYISKSEPDVNVTKGVVSKECIYQMWGVPGNSIAEFLTEFLNGTLSPSMYPWDIHGPAQLQAIYKLGNVSFKDVNSAWNNISESLTTYMRQHGAETYSAPATGLAFRDQTCVHIRWTFLIYPMILVLVTIIFFGCMVFQTREANRRGQAWKSSPLALLFHGLGPDALSRQERTKLTRASEMTRTASHVPVQLSQTGNGWQFVRQHRDSVVK